MSDTANTIRKKVERAEEHFANLKAALGVGGSPIDGPTDARIHVDAQGNLVYRTDLIEPKPEHGIMIGDIVHQLRSSLDHIAYAMAKPVCADPKILRKVQFPVYDLPAKLRDSHRFRALANDVFGVGSPQIAELVASQPYERNPTFPTADPLWIISELDNIDKHRTVIVVNPAVTASGKIFGGSGSVWWRARKQPIKAGTAVLNVGWSLPDPPHVVDVERATPFIVFSETDGLCDDMSIFPLIDRMINAVRDVIANFESKGLI